MNQHHQQILQSIQLASPQHSLNNDKYYGTSHHHYQLSNPQHRLLIKNWLKGLPQPLTAGQFISLLSALYQGPSYEEKTSGGLLIEHLPKLRQPIKPSDLDRWLDHLEGWAEIDSLCQNKLKATQFLTDWPAWQKQLDQFAKSQQIAKRRASLVLLTGPVADSSDPKLAAQAFKNIEQLQSENDILITKAISWLLRSLIKHHRQKVEQFIAVNKTTLPKIALRETRRKLSTGRK